MTTDEPLAREITDAILSVSGVIAVFSAHPVRLAAKEGLAGALDLPRPEPLADVETSDGFVTVTAHIAVDERRPAPETVRAAAAAARAVVDPHAPEALITVKARLVDRPLTGV